MIITTQEQIEEIIPKIALEWLHTPFHMNACVKGKGVDCVRFVVGVFKEAGLIPVWYEPPPEHADWFLGKKVDKQLFVRHIKRFGNKINFENRRPGDVFSYFVAETESHLAILLKDDYVIHAVRGKEVLKTRMRALKASFCAVYRIKI